MIYGNKFLDISLTESSIESLYEKYYQENDDGILTESISDIIKKFTSIFKKKNDKDKNTIDAKVSTLQKNKIDRESVKDISTELSVPIDEMDMSVLIPFSQNISKADDEIWKKLFGFYKDMYDEEKAVKSLKEAKEIAEKMYPDVVMKMYNDYIKKFFSKNTNQATFEKEFKEFFTASSLRKAGVLYSRTIKGKKDIETYIKEYEDVTGSIKSNFNIISAQLQNAFKTVAAYVKQNKIDDLELPKEKNGLELFKYLNVVTIGIVEMHQMMANVIFEFCNFALRIEDENNQKMRKALKK